MKKQTILSVVNQNYELKETLMEGKPTLVVPVVMMTEGVRNGSAGPILHLSEEMAKSVLAWNGVPVTIYHPEKNGDFISAKETPELYVGKIFDARLEEGKLKANAYIYVQKIAAIDPFALSCIQKQEPVEVSIGVHNKIKEEKGEHSGQAYNAVAVEYIPDHLALLPGSKGACSWEDGCGVRVNQESMTVCKMMQSLNEKGYTVGLIANAGYREIMEAAMMKLSGLETETTFYMLEEIYDNELVYSIRNVDTKEHSFFRVGYQYEANQVSFTGDPEQVERETTFTILQRAEEGSNKPSNNTKTKNDMSNNKQKLKVDALINNENTRFEETEREFLLQQPEEILAKLQPKEMPSVQVNKEQALEALKLEKPEDYLDLMPDSMKEKMSAGIKLYEEHREELIDAITSKTSETWSEDELKEMDTTMLEKLSKTVKPTVNYEGAGAGNGAQTNQEGEEEDMLLPTPEPKSQK